MKIIWLLVFGSISSSIIENVPECRVTFKFQKICHRYRIDASCQPPNKHQDCKKIKTTYNDRKCPQYVCVSKFKTV